jgi:hypothetical protein
MIERDLQNLFSNHIKAKKDKENACYELKICKGQSLPFDRVAEHQVDSLSEAKNNGIFHKIADMPWIKGRKAYTYKKPFDCFFIKANAYIVILFYKPKRMKMIYYIDIDVWKNEMTSSVRRSLTEQRAREISNKIEIL